MSITKVSFSLNYPALFVLVASLLFGRLASGNTEQIRFSYTACSNITAEQLTALQLYQRGIPLDAALQGLTHSSPGSESRLRYMYALAQQQGILNTYSDINTNYARCASLVHQKQGIPAIDKREYGYYFCAGENKRRFEIILHTDRNHTLEKLLELTPSTHHDVAKRYYRLISREGLLAAFDYTANNLKSCLEQLP